MICEVSNAHSKEVFLAPTSQVSTNLTPFISPRHERFSKRENSCVLQYKARQSSSRLAQAEVYIARRRRNFTDSANSRNVDSGVRPFSGCSPYFTSPFLKPESWEILLGEGEQFVSKGLVTRDSSQVLSRVD